MIRTKITCDITNKELKGQDLVSASTFTAQYKEVGKRTVLNDEGKQEIREAVIGMQNYSFHICKEHSAAFMEHIKKFFEERKK